MTRGSFVGTHNALIPRTSAFIWLKTAEQEREVSWEPKKCIMPGKIVPRKCCLPGSNTSMKKDFDADVLLPNVVTHFQVLSVTFIEYGQNVNKCMIDHR